MQAIPDNFVPDEYPAYFSQETDTATPRTPIPIYYIHDGDTPFCHNAHCFCQRGKRAGAMMYRQISEGKLQLVQLVRVRTRVPVSLLPTAPEDCQLFGHAWDATEQPDLKECALCHARGYCPGCTPIAPAGAQPFLCTSHARQVKS